MYQAPELASGLYDSSVDIYAVGVMMMEMASAGSQMTHVKRLTQYKRAANINKAKRTYGREFWPLLQRMFGTEPAERPSATECLVVLH